MVKLDTTTRQKQILEISLELIMEGGIQNLTMKRISWKVGISEQAIYRHFENKFAILNSIIKYFNDHFESVLKQISGIESTKERISRLIDIHLDYFEANPATATVIFSEEIFQNDFQLSQRVRKLVELRIGIATELIEKGQKQGDVSRDYPPADLAFVILGALRFLVTNWRLSGFSFPLKERGESLKRSLVGLISAG
jgi:TetR/AcrR family transcriptional regulator, fatty acid metabolism regulator protein